MLDRKPAGGFHLNPQKAKKRFRDAG